MADFAIYSLPSGNGELALSPVPGCDGDYASSLEKLQKWKPDIVVSMTEDAEMIDRNAGSLGRDLNELGVVWLHFPVVDFDIPDAGRAGEWQEVRDKVLATAPKPVLVGLTSQFVLLPLLTFLMVLVLKPQASVALGLILVAACPGGNISNFTTHRAGGNAALSVTMISCSGIHSGSGSVRTVPASLSATTSPDSSNAVTTTV